MSENPETRSFAAPPSAKLWGGRFSGSTDELVERLNNSLRFDARMWREDIDGSIAHATMLGETGIIPADDAQTIVDGLSAIGSDLNGATIELNPSAEDIHTAIEMMLKDRIGPVAGRLHTARSRNDQVATDTRLYLRRAIDEITNLVHSFQTTLVAIAELEIDTILPGYTHLQHAQPVLLSHHILAYFWMLQRDRERLADCRKRVNVLPLGAAALAGTPYPISRERVAELLEFDGLIENSLDAVSDRDFAIEFLAAASLLMVHLSRLAEEVILWNSPEFGFVELDDSVTTGSSIMPQKKNPDVAELVRGKTGRVFGSLLSLLTVMKGLPLSYNKDMQEDKEVLFDTIDTLAALLPPFEKTLATAQFRRDRMASALEGDFSTATDLADHLVMRGRTFREAHEVVGRIVRDCIEKGVGLEALGPDELTRYAPEFAQGGGADASVQASIESRAVRGGTGPAAVRKQLERARHIL